MNHRKTADKTKRLVWRVNQNAPLGEYVDPDAPLAMPEPSPPPERADRSFLASSFELTHGLEVSDETDTLPGDLFDELFKKK